MELSKQLDPLKDEMIYFNPGRDENGKGQSREERMGEFWDKYNVDERIALMLSAAIRKEAIGHGKEYDPFLSWKDIGCSPKLAITNYCLRLFEVKIN